MNQIDPAVIAAKVAEQQAQDTAGVLAVATPLPGPTKDVFAPVQSIQVGPYTIRPFYDIDFEFLTWLNHPLKDMAAKGDALDQLLPTGAVAWQLAWLFTHTVDQVDAVFAQGPDAAAKAARAEFGQFQIGALQAILVGVIQQLTVYWSPFLQYGPETTEGEQSSPPSPVP